MDISALPNAGELASLSPGRVHVWRPGLAPEQTRHSEILAGSRDGGGAGMALALALDGLRASRSDRAEECNILWVQDAASVRLTGRPYHPGLPDELRGNLIHVLAKRPEDALFALEEGLRCRDLDCVIGEVTGNPKALDFTASRRLSLAAERHGVPLFLVRHDAERDLSSARMRWQARSAPSPAPQWNAQAPGIPSWQAELFRARIHTPGEWILRNDGKALTAIRNAERPQAASPDHGGLAGAARDRSLAAS